MNNNTHRHSFRPAARAGRTRSYIASLALGTALLAAGCADREEVTRQNTATDTDMAYATATPEATTTATTRTDEQLQPTGRVQEDATMVLDEEKLDVQKRTVQEGGVLISKDVETREVTQPVELRTESVEVERLSPEEARQRGISTDQQQRFGEKEVYIPLAREEAVVQKEVQPRAVIQAETTTQTEQENVDATLRREVVDVERRQGGQQQMSTQQGGSQLEQQIRSELRNAQDLNLQDQQINQINIRVEQSRVTLSGTVPEQDMIEKIEQRVRQVQGVQSVENELRAQQ